MLGLNAIPANRQHLKKSFYCILFSHDIAVTLTPLTPMMDTFNLHNHVSKKADWDAFR